MDPRQRQPLVERADGTLEARSDAWTVTATISGRQPLESWPRFERRLRGFAADCCNGRIVGYGFEGGSVPLERWLAEEQQRWQAERGRAASGGGPC